jgi:hypothetical protein
MIFCGIDPGKTGGITFIHDGHIQMYTIPLIGKLVDLHEMYNILYAHLIQDGESHIACLEDVSSIPGASAGSNFAFGENKGHIEGLLVGMGASYQKVAPKAWQKVCWEGVPLMKKPCKGGEKNDTKAMSLVAAKRLFPGESFLASARSSVPHDGLVDAALIAKYGQIKYGK